MQKAAILSACLLIGMLNATASTTVTIDNFEQAATGAAPAGWNGYHDPESKAPQLLVVDDSISGEHALQVTLYGCQRYQGVQYFRAPTLPENARAITFLIKPVSGVPPQAVALSEQNERYGNDIATVVAPLKLSGTDWQKVTIELDAMKRTTGKDAGTPYTFAASKIYRIRLYGPVSPAPSIFLIDDISWICN